MFTLFCWPIRFCKELASVSFIFLWKFAHYNNLEKENTVLPIVIEQKGRKINETDVSIYNT